MAHATCVKLTVWFLTGLPAEITSHRTLLFQNPGLCARWGRWMLYGGVVCTGISSESLLIKRGLIHMKAVMFEIVNCSVQCIHLTVSDALKSGLMFICSVYQSEGTPQIDHSLSLAALSYHRCALPCTCWNDPWQIYCWKFSVIFWTAGLWLQTEVDEKQTSHS